MDEKLLPRNLEALYKSCFPRRIWERGVEYLEGGRVEELSLADEGLSAVVRGSGGSRYHVWLDEYSLMGDVDGYCSCPYGGDCKHLAAVSLLVARCCSILYYGAPLKKEIHDDDLNTVWNLVIDFDLPDQQPATPQMKQSPIPDRLAQLAEEEEARNARRAAFMIQNLKADIARFTGMDSPAPAGPAGQTKTQQKLYRLGMCISPPVFSRSGQDNPLFQEFELTALSRYIKQDGSPGATSRYSPAHEIVNGSADILEILEALRQREPQRLPAASWLNRCFECDQMDLYFSESPHSINQALPLTRKRAQSLRLGWALAYDFDHNPRCLVASFRMALEDSVQTDVAPAPGPQLLASANAGSAVLISDTAADYILNLKHQQLVKLPPLTPIQRRAIFAILSFREAFRREEAGEIRSQLGDILAIEEPPGEIEKQVVRPECHLYFKPGQPGRRTGELRLMFQYPDIKYDFGDGPNGWLGDDESGNQRLVYLRDLSFEQAMAGSIFQALEEPLSESVRMTAGTLSIDPGESPALIAFLADTLPTLELEAPVQVFIDSRPLHIRPAKGLKVIRSSGIDWLDLELALDDGETLPAGAFHAASGILELSSGYVRLDDKSRALLERLTDRSDAGDRLRVHSLDFEAAQLLEELGDAETFSVLRTLTERASAFRALLSQQLTPPAAFKGQLRDYQLAGFVWLHALWRLGYGGILADDMGLGKTVQIIAFIARVLEDAPESRIILAVPVSTLGNWQREFERFLPAIPPHLHHGIDRKLPDTLPPLLLTGYHTLARDADVVAQRSWDIAVFDEGQSFKNHRTDIHAAVRNLPAASKLILSGTPVENRIEELWSLMSVAMPGLLGSHKDFRGRYIKYKTGDGARAPMEELQRRLRPFMLRRTKKEVALQLPEKQEQLLYVDQDEAERRFYLKQEAICRSEVSRLMNQISDSKSAFRAMTELVRSLNHLRMVAVAPRLKGGPMKGAKLSRVLEKLEEAWAEGHSVLIFSQYVKVLDILMGELEKRNAVYAYLDGSLTPKKRQQQIDHFSSNPGCRTFLLSIKAGGTGINLVKADHVFIVDPWWNPAVENQAIDRSHRIGQENPVLATRFIVKDSIEEKVLALQNSKRELVDNFMGGDESIFSRLDADEIMGLFQP